MASRFEISGVTDQLFDSLLKRRAAVQFEKELLFEMQKHRDELASKARELRSGGGSRGDRTYKPLLEGALDDAAIAEARARKRSADAYGVKSGGSPAAPQGTAAVTPRTQSPVVVYGPKQKLEDPRTEALRRLAQDLGTN